MKAILFILIALSLVGCATQQQMISGFESSAAVSLRAVEDNNLKVLVFSLCATPLSALIRHPELTAGAADLCLPNGGRSSPILLLQAPQQPILPTTGSLIKP